MAAAASGVDLDALARVLGRAEPRTFDVVGSFLGKRNFSRFELEDVVGGALAACCGAGTIPLEATLACAVLRAVGFDLDPAALATARRNVAAGSAAIELAIADAAALPLPGGAADRIVTNPPWETAVGVAGRLRADPASFAAELLRVLAPGGRAVVLAPSRSALARAARTATDVLLECGVRVSGAAVSVVVLGRHGDETAPIDSGGLFGREPRRG